MSEEINKERLPTPADLIIFDWLKQGQSISNAEAITKFSNACLRDCVWRLGNAGHFIDREWVYYTNSKGQKKKYKRYFITPPEIVPNGFKTQKQEKELLKGTKPVHEHAGNIARLADKPKVVQTSIF